MSSTGPTAAQPTPPTSSRYVGCGPARPVRRQNGKPFCNVTAGHATIMSSSINAGSPSTPTHPEPDSDSNAPTEPHPTEPDAAPSIGPTSSLERQTSGSYLTHDTIQPKSKKRIGGRNLAPFTRVQEPSSTICTAAMHCQQGCRNKRRDDRGVG